MLSQMWCKSCRLFMQGRSPFPADRIDIPASSIKTNRQTLYFVGKGSKRSSPQFLLDLTRSSIAKLSGPKTLVPSMLNVNTMQWRIIRPYPALTNAIPQIKTSPPHVVLHPQKHLSTAPILLHLETFSLSASSLPALRSTSFPISK